MHQAICMDSLANQKQYFNQILGGQPAKPVTDTQNQSIENRSLNEENPHVGKSVSILASFVHKLE